MVSINENDYIAHYGIIRRSGRYPWGSTGNVPGSTDMVSSRNMTLLAQIKDLKRQGLTDTEIAKGLGMSSTQFRRERSIANNQLKQAQIAQALRLKDKAMSDTAAAERMGIPTSTFRTLLQPATQERAAILENVAQRLKDEVDNKKYVMVGTGVEHSFDVSKDKLATAVQMLVQDGYTLANIKQKQIGTGLDTEVKVLAPPGTTQKDIWLNRGEIKTVTGFSNDGGRTVFGIAPPLPVNPSRVAVAYKEDGGDKEDGVIYIRPGKEDLSLGTARYAQVRVQVGDGHYLKGMAMYKNDLPPGVDILFNTNKSDTGNKLDALKPLTGDPDNPFGAIISRQLLTRDADGKEQTTSAMNIVNEEGDWGKWSKTIASQVLSKQSPKLAKTQLDMTYQDRKRELNEIKQLTNPAVRKKLLEGYADGVDAAAVQLKAANLPRQGWHAILPINSIDPTQIYAPNYQNGERVVLLRYPHGGTFEIPELIVNNSHPEGKQLLGTARDAVGIHSSVASWLSGADFDGDTVLVIPNNTNRITTTRQLEGLKDFDPVTSFPGYPGMKTMTNMQNEMGQISNLITDMTIKNAPPSEIVRAVKHSMVIVDSEKKGLNYKESAAVHGIRSLKQKYQSSPDEPGTGAATLISRAKSAQFVPARKDRPISEGGPIDSKTGERRYKETGETSWKTGKPKLQRSTKLAETTDAHTVSSGTPMERLYADHSNRLKTLANEARLEYLNTPNAVWSQSARRAYAKEVASLDSKLTLIEMNRPLERQAQLLANSVIRTKREVNPNMDRTTRKKIEYQALQEMRNRVGLTGKERKVIIEPGEWEAIQAGAISNSKLTQILNKADMDVVKALATPRSTVLMTPAKVQRAQAMFASGATRAEVAKQLGVSLSTLDRELYGE